MKFASLILVIILTFCMITSYFIILKSSESSSPQQKITIEKIEFKKQEIQQDQRSYILSKHLETKVQDINFGSQFQKLSERAINISLELQKKNPKFSKSIYRSIQIPFRNSFLEFAFTKYEKGVQNLVQEYIKCMTEPATLVAITSIIRPHFKIIDCGSHYGFYSIQMASLLDENQGGKQFVFEANPLSIQFVNLTFTINNLKRRIELYNFAIYNKTQEIEFNLYQRSYQNQINEISQQRQKMGILQKFDKQIKTQIKILAIKLDDFFPPEVLPEAHLMKLDIESSDLMAIQGARQIIRRSPDITIIMELNGKIFEIFGEKYVEEQFQ